MAKRSEIETWICACALGDKAAFESLYGATSAKLFGVCLRVLTTESEAKDALQETYIKVWRNAGRYQINGLSPMSWLITIARNTAIDKLRKQRGVEHSAPGELLDAVPDSAPGPEQTTIARSEMERLGVCLRELEPAHAAAVRGVYLDGKTYADLASEAKVPLNTMRTWLRRSLLKLKECLAI